MLYTSSVHIEALNSIQKERLTDMKKTLSIVLALMLVLACFAACGKTDKPDADVDNSLQNVLDAGKLVIATSPDFPPFENLNDDGSVTGIEIDILSRICTKLGVDLQIDPYDFDAILTGLDAGKYDLAVSGITATEERKENALFTNPYCLSAISLVVPEGSPIQTKADVEDKAISCQTGTTAELYCQKNNLKNSAFTANADAQMALTTGKVDVWAIDKLTAIDMVAVYNEEHEDKLVVLDEPLTYEPYGFASKLGNDALIEAINAALAELIADGTVKSLFDSYGAEYVDPSVDPTV